MSKARSFSVYALLILPLLASMSVGALAQNSQDISQDDSPALSFQPVPPITFIGPSGSSFQIDRTVPDNDTQVAENVTATLPDDPAYSAQTTQAAPPPPQVRKVERQVKRKVRRWHIGGRIGEGFSPELFMFGVQSEIGPIFNPRVVFRPNVEFGFGELTDMFDVNLEGAYRLRETLHGRWTPYFGMGPSLNLIHRGASSGDVSFSDFSYKTGFNVFLGAQKDRTFVEIKTSLWADQTPVLRLFLGYNF